MSSGLVNPRMETDKKTSALTPSSRYQDLKRSNTYVSTCLRVLSRLDASKSKFAAAREIASGRSMLIFLSKIIRKIPRLARLSAKGSRDPEGGCPILKIPTSVSSLSASDKVIPTLLVGILSPEKRGRYCSSRASATSDCSPS